MVESLGYFQLIGFMLTNETCRNILLSISSLFELLILALLSALYWTEFKYIRVKLLSC